MDPRKALDPPAQLKDGLISCFWDDDGGGHDDGGDDGGDGGDDGGDDWADGGDDGGDGGNGDHNESSVPMNASQSYKNSPNKCHHNDEPTDVQF